MMKESGSARRTEKLGKDFMNIIEPMKKTLEVIKTTCEELEEKSSEAQAEKTLRDMEEFKDVLRRVSELKTKSEGLLKTVTTKSAVNDGVVGLLVSVLRFTPTSERSAKLRASILRSSHQCEQVTDELEKMRDEVLTQHQQNLHLDLKMETEPKRRRRSRDLPPHLSELMNTLIKYAKEFISQFDSRESEMRRIVGELKKFADEVREMQEKTDAAAVVAAGAGLAAGIIFAPFTVEASLLAATAPGSLTVVGANTTKVFTEKKQAEKVEKLGRDFMNIIEPMKKTLEEIKTTCEELEEKSCEAQAEKTLRDMEEFKDVLRRVSELKTESKVVLNTIVGALTFLNELLELRASIIRLADQCEQVTDELQKMRDKVKVFRGQGRNVLKMAAAGSKRRWSIELPPDLGLSFRKQFLQNKDRMKDLVDELQSIAAKVKEGKTGLSIGDVVAGVGAAIGGAASALFSGGLSSGLLGAGGRTPAGFAVKGDDQTREARRLTEEFMMITKELRRELRHVEAECRELRRSGPSSTLVKLDESIQQLFDFAAELRAPGAPGEVEAAAAQCLKVHEGFVKVESGLPPRRQED
ncbi:hypothetical protein INR49_011676 [Caranx melampygus]|nr:hypothetical protein INR49_011676 [Caranx melampygus]